MSHIGEGDKAWIGLLAYVAAYDVFAMVTGKETLSSAFYRAATHPKGRMLTLGSWALLTGHLFRLIPTKYDPFRQLGLQAARYQSRRSQR